MDRNQKILDLMGLAPVIPVLVIDDVDQAVPLAQALVAGGLRVLEITLRTPVALECIERIGQQVPGVIVGAGTVNRPIDADAARSVGAQFLVSPGSTLALLDEMDKTGLPYLAGAATASEVLGLLERGITAVKFFPAEPAGGVAYLKALSGPLPDIRFCPTGGIDPVKAKQYLALPNVPCVGGSWLVPKDALASGDYARIEALAREAASLAA
ncbi:keto-deoxy-phosphogluconate aldolase [Elstera litoralis]|uniref:2-dehydro-3-deoxy-phosphogluconate aldolase n=1 Tax=Elstera litoralis TaxID=552518 RepID=A0A0F3IPS4_9PROT|nr:bifunctional 4-hydroxy-2-oxoglutarate aldolase/2-dehydro-3-deoxy-phosphogluconate aldolase [Elstera litoralis]KJV08543.1 keto-deoxy-phosphogluconate aldolase [Elstera litoralis]